MTPQNSPNSSVGLDFSAVNTEEATWQWEPFLWSNGGKLLDLTAAPAKEAFSFGPTLFRKGQFP